MKTTRLIAVPALAAASLLALTGCFQLPPVGGTTGDNTGGTGQTPDTGGAAAGEDLAGTTWTGGELGPGFAELDFTLNADGTIDITTWNGGSGFDVPSDTWSGDSANLTMVITQLRDQQGDSEPFDVTLSGSAEDGQLEVSGDSPQGPLSLTASQG